MTTQAALWIGLALFALWTAGVTYMALLWLLGPSSDEPGFIARLLEHDDEEGGL